MSVVKLARSLQNWYSFIAQANPGNDWLSIEEYEAKFREAGLPLSGRRIGPPGSESSFAFGETLERAARTAAMFKLAVVRETVRPTAGLRLPFPTQEFCLTRLGLWLSRRGRKGQVAAWTMITTAIFCRYHWKPVAAFVAIGAFGAAALKAFEFYTTVLDYLGATTGFAAVTAVIAAAAGAVYAWFRHITSG